MSTAKPDDITAAEKLIFEYTGDDLETRLRMAVAFIRDDSAKLPKDFWVKIIQKIYESEVHSIQDKANLFDNIMNAPCYISFYSGHHGQGGAFRRHLVVPGKHYDKSVERKATNMARKLGACSFLVFKPIGMPVNIYYGNLGEDDRLERLKQDNE